MADAATGETHESSAFAFRSSRRGIEYTGVAKRINGWLSLNPAVAGEF
jgi:hypothetical protein